MPRTLPWLRDGPNKTQCEQSTSSRARKRCQDTDDLVDPDLNENPALAVPRRKKAAQPRSPSTSPPPAPPTTEYMPDGYTTDDRWMMVEDEFAATAQLFTNHIHHAEYVRLKEIAKSKGEEALQSLTRPTDNRTSLSKQARLTNEAKANRSMVAGSLIENLDAGEEPEAWQLHPALATLMTQRGDSNEDLRSLVRPRARTRAAAGYSQSPSKRVEKKAQPPEVYSKKPDEPWSDDLDFVLTDQGERDSAICQSSSKESKNSYDLSSMDRSGKSLDSTERQQQAFDTKRGHRNGFWQEGSENEPAYDTKERQGTQEQDKHGVKDDPDERVSDVLARRKARRERLAKEALESAKKNTEKRFDDIPTFII